VIHLLLIAEESQALAHAASLLSSSDHKVIRKDNFDSSRSLLDTGVFDLLVVLIAGTDESLGLLRSIRAETGSLPLVALATTETVGVDQKAYNAGADLVLHAPISHDSFVRATRHWLNQPANNPASVAKPAFALAQTPSVSMTTSALEVLRNFSKVLSYSLDHEQFTQHFVLKLREILSVNRVAIFLESPPPGTSVQPQDGRGRDRLSCVAAVGIPSDLLACIELSRQNGIGRNITRIGQILRADVDVDFSPASDDVKIRREFEILGCQVALPITDRERTLGVALIGGRVTGNPLNDAELQLVYHLLEELGLAVKNSWLHHQLTESHRLFSDVLGCISIGSLVIGSDLAVQHANRAFLRFIRGEAQSDGRLDFSELPPPLASALHDLAENGRLTEPFFLTPEKNPGRTYRVSLVPFPSPDRRLPQPVIALIEDFTQIQAVQRAEVEASNLKLIALIAKRFAHEIRNSLVPLSTHHQLIDTDYDSPEFRESLKTALGRETGRIQRFTEQMLFLSQPAHPADGWISIGALLHEAFNQATRALGADAHLAISGGQEDRAVRVHHASLVHALEEIFINSLQETTPGGVIRVELSNDSDAQGAASISLRFRDEGAGFTRETATRATEPFFTTRTTGVGLGLTVARRIIENHSGRLEVNEKHNLADADIAIHLPLD
jgi:signal transduction histidine kinase/DNA-binding response OmpR family regulator